MLNVRNLIVDAFKMIGDLSDREALDGTRSNIGLQLLNDVISQMNLNEFFAFMINTISYSPTSSEFSYSIGTPTAAHPTVDINADRPSKILRAYTRYKPNGSIASEIQMVAPQDIMMFRTDGVSLPNYFAYESSYPHANIVFSSQFDTNYELILNYSKNLPSVAFNDDLEIPPEYEPSLKYALSYLLAQRYGKDDSILIGMRDLRNTAFKDIQENTTAKTPLIAHFGQSAATNNIFTMSRWGV
jgi:hypothetical protein